VFEPGGKLLRTIGRPGTAAGEFNGPTHIQFNDGRLYVTDTLNARVQVMTAQGDVTAEIGRRGLYVGNLVRPKGVTNDMHGNVYVIESYYDHLLVFDADGNLLMPIGGTGNQVGQFFLPAGIWSDTGDRIFIADMFNGRVIVLRYLGG
jgi:DNA-binding beta-propeller fold protein YncE